MTTPKPPSHDVSRGFLTQIRHIRTLLTYRHQASDFCKEDAEGYGAVSDCAVAATHHLRMVDKYAEKLEAGYEAAKGGGWMPITDKQKNGKYIIGFWSYLYPGDEAYTLGCGIIRWNKKANQWENSHDHDDAIYTHFLPLPNPEQL